MRGLKIGTDVLCEVAAIRILNMFVAHYLFGKTCLLIQLERAEAEICFFKTTARLKNKRTSMAINGQRPVPKICHVPDLLISHYGHYLAKDNDVILILLFLCVFLCLCIPPREVSFKTRK